MMDVVLIFWWLGVVIGVARLQRKKQRAPFGNEVRVVNVGMWHKGLLHLR